MFLDEIKDERKEEEAKRAGYEKSRPSLDVTSHKAKLMEAFKHGMAHLVK